MICLLAGCADNQTAVSEQSEGQSTFNAEGYYERLEHCVEQIQEKTDFVPDIVLVLGSGMGDYADSVKVIEEITHEEVQDASNKAADNLTILINGLLSAMDKTE